MIITFGSINLDIVTRVPNIPRPGETVKGDSYRLIPGGKGANQALAAKRAGSDCMMVGATGSDDFAKLALAQLNEDGVDLSRIAATSEPTGIAMIAVDDGGENAICVAGGANRRAEAEQLQGLSAFALLTQQEVREDEVWAALKWAKRQGLLTIHNAAPADLIPEDVLDNLDWLLVNETEALIVAQGADIDTNDPVEAAKRIAEILHTNVLITLGHAGAHAFGQQGEFHAPALDIEVKDTTAAGDTFAGAFAAALDQGMDIETALRRAAIAGSLACTKHGAQPSIPYKSEIDAHAP